MEDSDFGYGPGGMGCVYCVTNCPNCNREVFDSDIIYGDSETYCTYCKLELDDEKEDKLSNEEDFDDEDFDDEEDEFDEDDSEFDED